MNYMTYLIIFAFTILSAFGETFQYELKGTLKQSGREKLINYGLKWTEQNGHISGVYSDDYFSPKSEVRGEGGDLGRTFIVAFPQNKDGVRSLTILSSLVKKVDTATTVPVSIVTRDEKGNPLTNIKTSANFITTSFLTAAQLQEENRCSDGFGVLAGFCGTYAGMLTEERDRRNRCNLLFADAVRLELNQEGMLILHLGELNNVAESPFHTIGRIPFNPQKNAIDVMSRVCAPLHGLNLDSTSCKVLHLRGDFARNKDNLHFSGTYQISEEGTSNVCVYGLSMDKVEGP